MSVAHRFGKEGHAVALVSRRSEQHPGFVGELAGAGIEAAAFTADVTDPAQLRTAVEGARARFGRIDVLWFGPGAMDGPAAGDIRGISAAEMRAATETILLPAIDAVSLVLPELRERGSGGLLFAGGVSSVIPLPPLGALALTAAELRNYALTLHAALAPDGVYSGTLTIGGIIKRGDIHAAVRANPELVGGIDVPTPNPDDLAETARRLDSDRSALEAVASP